MIINLVNIASTMHGYAYEQTSTEALLKAVS